jgi:hypothetical protein
MASIFSLSSFSGLVRLFICRLPIERVNNINSHARRRVPQVRVLRALILRALFVSRPIEMGILLWAKSPSSDVVSSLLPRNALWLVGKLQLGETFRRNCFFIVPLFSIGCGRYVERRFGVQKYSGSIVDLASEACCGSTNVPRHECIGIFEQYGLSMPGVRKCPNLELTPNRTLRQGYSPRWIATRRSVSFFTTA